MMNVVSKRCVEEECNKIPNYNFPGQKKPEFCSNHKKINMMNVVSKRCVEEECNKQPDFNYSDEDNGKYCSKHKKYLLQKLINIFIICICTYKLFSIYMNKITKYKYYHAFIQLSNLTIFVLFN